MRLFVCFTALGLLAPGVASAATTVIGGGLAQQCYEAAELERHSTRTLGLCDRAILEEALQLTDLVATHVNRGIIRARLNDWPGALADYDKAIRLNAKEPEAYLNKGALLLKQNEWANARKMFDAALDYRTSRPELAHFGRAVIAEIAGDLTSAYADYQKASSLAPEWEQPKQELARFTVRKGG